MGSKRQRQGFFSRGLSEAYGGLMGLNGGGGSKAGGGGRNFNRGGKAGQSFNQLENLLLPYDQLVAEGRIGPNERGFSGLSGNESRLGRGVQEYENSLASGSPIFAAYRDTVQQGLKGIESGLPDDVRRSITENLRSAQASRGNDGGTLFSDTSGIEEVVRLFGGEQAIRSQRLSEASNYFNQVQGGALQTLLPSFNQLYSGNVQQTIAGGQLRNERNKLVGDYIGAGVGAVASGLI